MVYVWLGLIVAFIAVEAATVNLVSIWFIGGSVAGLVCAILGAPTLLQFAVFILVSALLLALLRPLLKKYLRVKPSRTNADRLLGQEALVTEDIDNLRETGAIRINGVLWTAKSVDDTQISSRQPRGDCAHRGCKGLCQTRRSSGRSIRQHRAIASSRFDGSFPPILRFERFEIHRVFLHFPNLDLMKNLSPNQLAELCGAAISHFFVRNKEEKHHKEDVFMEWIPVLVIAVLALVIIVRNIYVVQQSRAYVVERLGAFSNVWTVGIHFKVPFVERVAKKVSLKEQVLDYPPQPVITKDNVTMQIDTVVYFQITDPKLYAYGVEHPMMAMETLTATTLRNIIGDLELDQTLTSRDVINTRMRAILDEATDPWGIKVNRVELKNILPPQDIQNSMEKQMKAERDRRQAILQAEGAKHSQILVAEGEKEAAILKADAEKQAAILRAEAEKESAILRADGEAQAIRAVQQALADSLALLNEKAPNDQVLKLKALEAMQKVADGKATKIIIPSEIQGLAGLASGITEAVKEAK